MKSVLFSFAACLSLATTFAAAVDPEVTAPAAPDCTFRPTQTITALEGCPTNCETVDQCYADGELSTARVFMIHPILAAVGSCLPICRLTGPLSRCHRARVRMFQDGR